VQKADELQLDLINLDIGLPHVNGIRAATLIRQRSPHSKLVFLSQSTKSEIRQATIAVGQADDLAKANVATELLDNCRYTRRSLHLTRTEILARMSLIEATQFGFWNRKLCNSARQANP
jgi:DNA-binding NarL/FixJ family response regulator